MLPTGLTSGDPHPRDVIASSFGLGLCRGAATQILEDGGT